MGSVAVPMESEGVAVTRGNDKDLPGSGGTMAMVSSRFSLFFFYNF